MRVHSEYLKNKHQNAYLEYDELNKEFEENEEELEKSKLNFDILVRIKKRQDEITDSNGPQAYVDDLLLVDSYIIDDLNKKINMMHSIKVKLNN